MNTAGWMVMILSIGTVVTLMVFCLYRVLTLPSVEAEEELEASSIASAVVVCPKCGGRNQAHAKHCAQCGKPIG